MRSLGFREQIRDRFVLCIGEGPLIMPVTESRLSIMDCGLLRLFLPRLGGVII